MSAQVWEELTLGCRLLAEVSASNFGCCSPYLMGRERRWAGDQLEPWEEGKDAFFQGFLSLCLAIKGLCSALRLGLSFSWAGRGDAVPPGQIPRDKGSFWAAAAGLALVRAALSLAIPWVASAPHTPTWLGPPRGWGGTHSTLGKGPWEQKCLFPRINAAVSLWPHGCSTAGSDPVP